MERNDFLTNTCTRSWDCTSLNERRGNGSWANVCESPFNRFFRFKVRGLGFLTVLS
jgi:hypothetical protein